MLKNQHITAYSCKGGNFVGITENSIVQSERPRDSFEQNVLWYD